jgi:hypothetical protein
MSRPAWSLLAVATAACGGSNPATPDAGASYNCAAETRGDTFVAGLEKLGSAGKVDFKLMTAMPAPPARGDNTWVVQLSAAGAPVTGATITATPFMPDHRHGTPITVTVTPTATPGEYTLTPVNLWMPGLWETTIEVTPAGQPKDAAVFRFCIAS